MGEVRVFDFPLITLTNYKMIRAIVILILENSASSDIRYTIQGSSLKENALQMSDF